MLKICRKLPSQKFEDCPFKEEILSFIRDLGHTGEIKLLSDVNVNHLHQPWRSFVAVINKYLSGKTTALENLVYEVENKNSKKNNDMYYPCFTKVIVDYFMAKDEAIPRRNKMFWQYVRDDLMFTTIRVIFKHQDTQVYNAILPQHLTNQAMLESKAYKTYRAYATSEKTPKPKSTKKKADSESSPKTKLTQASKGKKNQDQAEQIKLATKRSLIQNHISHASGLGADEGTGSIPRVPDVPTYESDDEQISWKSSKEDDDDEVNVSEDDDDDNDDDIDKDDEDDDADNQDDENPDDANQDDDNEQTESDNDSDDFVRPKVSTHDDEARQDDVVNEEESDDESDEDGDEEIQDANVEGDRMNEEETNEEAEVDALYRDVNVNLEGRDTEMTDAPRTIVQTTQVIEDTHVIITPVNPEDEAQAENADFLNKLDDNIKKIIKDQVKEQVKAQVSKILPKIKKTVNEQLKAEVLTRSSNESKTSHAVAANLSELELKKFPIDKMEINKSIHRPDEQKNLYKALVNAYESDKLILDTYGDIVSFKRHKYDEDKDKEPSAGSNRGSKRRRARKDPESTSAPKEKNSKTTGKSTEGSKSHHKSTGESAQAKEPMHTAKDLE
ncbi:hypothetical protein Tco_1046443 [Tanacetum coccineum]